MINELILENYRGFSKHRISFSPTSIVVGRNNAGKSTIVEALRLVSFVANRYENLQYRNVPEWLDIPARCRGVSPSLRNTGINLENAFHRYGEPPAIISAKFTNGSGVTIYLGPNASMHGVVYDENGDPVGTRGQAQRVEIPTMAILPQVAPLEKEEKILSEEYVYQSMGSDLSPLHFRNQINFLFDDYFRKFKKNAEISWPGLRLNSLEGQGGLQELGKLDLLVQDGDFVGEISMMGHGLQMWLQTIWFLTYSEKDDVVVLDEPDVYMHPDLQRRLIRLVRNAFKQMIVMTHSVEIMSEVSIENILIVDRKKSKSCFANSLPAVQGVLENLGTGQNVHLTRLWSSKKFLLIEGSEISYLKAFQDKIFPESEEPFDALPHMAYQGWGGWQYVIGSSMFLKNAGGDKIMCYCFMDHDYHTEDQIIKRKKEAEERGIQLHIWARKEIENYLLDANTIARLIQMENAEIKCDATSIKEAISSIADALKDEVFYSLMREMPITSRSKKEILSSIREIIESAWKSYEGKIGLVGGKAVLAALNQHTQKKFRVAITPAKIINAMHVTDVPQEIVKVIECIEQCESFG